MRVDRTGFPRGITLVEVLTSSLIICISIAVILPGISAARGTARRVQCLNNMRQVALALQNYDQAHGSLPPGVVDPNGPIRNYPEGHHWGWLLQLLPFMEQNGIAGALDSTASVYSPANASATSALLSSLQCPSGERWASPATPGVRTSSSYAGCHNDSEAPIDADNRGVLFLNSSIRYEDVTDGTGNTIYFGERRVDFPDYGWLSGTRSTLRNTGWPINGSPVLTPSTLKTPAQAVIPVGGFGSGHPGGANIGFGDGSIRFVRDSIQPAVFRLLGNRDDGEPISGESY